jgi:altronate hydrolase
MSTQASVASAIIRLHPGDDVIIATRQLLPGTRIDAEQLVVTGLIPPGHKIATRDIAKGEPVKRYNQIIGVAREAIARGQHVHVQNLGMSEFAREHVFGVDAQPTAYVKEPAHFMGIRRGDGRIATRNYIGILTSVNCSATVARAIADHFRRDVHPDALADYPNVDGVIALTHGLGCGIDTQGEGIRILRRTLAGYAVHPNFASVLFVGLGCETNQIDGVLEAGGLGSSDLKLRSFTIQDSGGTRKTIERGIAMVQEMLADANRIQRVPVPASHLSIGLQCGGSDGYSGISANPALGAAVDRVVRHGGTAILSDDPRKIARRGREGRHDESRRRLRIRAAGRRKRPRVHGFAGLRPGVRDGPGCLRCERDLLHDGARLRVWLRAVAVAEVCDEQHAVGASGGRHRPQLRRRDRRQREHRRTG